MFKFSSFFAAVCFMGIALVSCKDKEKAPLSIPTSYISPVFSANVATEDAIRTQLENLVTEIKKGRVSGTSLDFAVLSGLYNAGNPSLKSLTTSYYNGRLEGPGNWLEELAKASGGAYTPGIPTGQGGTFEGYLFEENGLELEQMVEKGLFTAALYNHAIGLMKGEINNATVDKLLRIYGAHPDFPNTPTASKAANPDKFVANYAARRDNNDGTGLYFQMKGAFLTLQAALSAGVDYNEERDAALLNLREVWEKVIGATVINYCHTVIATMSATNTSNSDKAKALHAYGECVGFLHGWRGIPQEYKMISETDIDILLNLLNAPFNGTPTSYTFVTNPVSELPKLQEIILKLQLVYSFSNEEIEDFKKNWVAEQGR